MRKTILLAIIICILSVKISAQLPIDSSLVLYPDNIIKITFDNSDKIKAAFYNLESAKYNFKLFEREYTQFNPLNFSSKMNTNSNREHTGEVSVGMNKEFFNGASISTAVGNSSGWGNNPDKWNTNFIETEFSFPLFSSARTLDRIIKRTFEENELFTKNLNYVDAVRNNIHTALEQYYDLVPRIKIYNMLKRYRGELRTLCINDSANISYSDKQLLQGEITTLNSKITGWEISLYSMQLSMQRYMNVSRIILSQLSVIDLNFTKPFYFGKYYIEEPLDSIFKKALFNDTEFKVLGIIKNNAEEKKRLAQKGKWDIYATTGGRYNFYDLQNGDPKGNFIIADAGLKIKLFDQKTLKYTISKAQADISSIEYTIEDRKKLIYTDISGLKDGLLKKKEQLLNTLESLQSWQKIYNTKKELFLSGKESADNYILAFRSLVSTEETRYNLENNYFDTIRDFDYVCGTYFSIIELKY